MPDVFVKNPAGWNFEFHTWGGELGRWLSKKTVETQVRAMTNAPSKTGRLKSSIMFSLGYSGSELESTVYSRLPHAEWVHEGTPPHMIYPVRAPKLSFYWPKVGRTVHLAKVSHPGIQNPQPFLADAVAAAFRSL